MSIIYQDISTNPVELGMFYLIGMISQKKRGKFYSKHFSLFQLFELTMAKI